MQINLLYRPTQTVAQCWLAANESVTAESGAMVGMSTNVQMQTQAGGLGSGIKRMFGGESFFRNTFTAYGGNGEVLFATALSGDMVVLEAGPRQWCIQNSSYVASSSTVDVRTRTHGIVKGLFSGAGFFILETSGHGQVVIGGFGALEPLTVDGSIVIDTGHIAAWESTLEYEVVKSGSGWVASYLSGEGVVCRFKGQGTIYLQARNAAEYGSTIGRLLPPREG